MKYKLSGGLPNTDLLDGPSNTQRFDHKNESKNINTPVKLKEYNTEH